MLVSEGAVAPDFSVKDTEGAEVSKTALRGRPAVLHFMAGAGPGCTAQACAMRDSASDFETLDAQVVLISARDDGASFKRANELPGPVVCDPKGELQKKFGIPPSLFGLIPGRVTVVLKPDGTVAKVYNAQLSFADHVSFAKEAVEELK